MDVDSYLEQQEADPDHAHAPEAIGSIAVHGVDKAYGTGRSAAGWKLWAATTGGRLVAIDTDRLECVEHIRFPVSTWPLRKFALASRGQVLAAAFGGRALLWDTRCASAARSSPVASVGKGGEDDGFFWDDDADPRSVVAMDDWSAWLAHEGCEGVALYDVRMAVGPPRLCQERLARARVVEAIFPSPSPSTSPVLSGVEASGPGASRGVGTACWWWRRRTRTPGRTLGARCTTARTTGRATGEGGGGGLGIRARQAEGAKGREEGGEEEVPQATGGEVPRERLGGDATTTTTRRTRERSVV